MEENRNDEVITVKYEYESPSVGEQLIAAAIGVGVSLAALAVISGGATVYYSVKEKIRDRRAEKRRQKIDSVETTTE